MRRRVRVPMGAGEVVLLSGDGDVELTLAALECLLSQVQFSDDYLEGSNGDSVSIPVHVLEWALKGVTVEEIE